MTAAGGPRDGSSYEELFDGAPCGYLTTTLDGTVLRVNRTLLRWLGHGADELLGTAFLDWLTTGSRVFYQTRGDPVLRLHGELLEVALSLRTASGGVLPVLVNSLIAAGADGAAATIRTAVFDSTRRQDYERQLLAARHEAEESESRVLVLRDTLERLALYDQLTGLAGRKLFEQRLAEISASTRPFAVVFLDLDGFKAVNDRFGHEAGDEVLRAVGGRLRRAAETTDFVSRRGGDEFVVVCEGDGLGDGRGDGMDETRAAIIAGRLIAAVREPISGLDGVDRITASAGVAVRQRGAAPVSVMRLLELADAAMYVSKNTGRDRVTVVSTSDA